MTTDTMREEYERRRGEIRRAFEVGGDGLAAVVARSALVDELVMRLWDAECARDARLGKGVAVVAVGGYGRGQLFPYSDVDLLFVVEKGELARAKEPIRRVSQALWDCGMQVSLTTRPPGECERFDAANPEFGLALLDARGVGGDAAVLAKMETRCLARLVQKDAKAIANELAALTRERHAKYGFTLFHLEPNIKDCPGGLRDANVCGWLRRLRDGAGAVEEEGEFAEAVAFLAAVRCFLHYRHERDDNTLDWVAQDAAAAGGIGSGNLSRGLDAGRVDAGRVDAGRVDAGRVDAGRADAAYWMRAYFRHARILERRVQREFEASGLRLKAARVVKRAKIAADAGFVLKDGQIVLAAHAAGRLDAAHEPEVVLAAFAVMAQTGARLSAESERRIADGVPLLSENIEDGPALWQRLCTVLTADGAAEALRTMHALGVLELILPEFHGIDALVIRDAYHRYTVDEHTFVLIETLHGLADVPAGAADWRVKFGTMVRELQNPGLLYLAALMHDTGKGRQSEDHAAASAAMASSVLKRLEMDAYDSALVMRLIEMHLEMSAALRRDIFDAETVKAFSGKVQSQELLRMLTLFTYADIAAVHPDALTPWKAENLWRLSMATANQLDRSVDEERVYTGATMVFGKGIQQGDDKLARVLGMAAGREREVKRFLDGFPERYVKTRSAETMFRHFSLTEKFEEEPFQISFRHGPVSVITLVTQDRPRLFAGMAAALAAWGMNVVTADAFANAAGVVVDSFRFTDTFKTLELNESERGRFVESVRELVAGRASVERMLSGRRRGRKKTPRVSVETKITFDGKASSHSTLLQVIAQDLPGLLRAVSATVSAQGYNVEVALIDTEGESAIDVFYLTKDGNKLGTRQELELKTALLEAIEANAG